MIIYLKKRSIIPNTQSIFGTEVRKFLYISGQSTLELLYILSMIFLVSDFGKAFRSLITFGINSTKYTGGFCLLARNANKTYPNVQRSE